MHKDDLLKLKNVVAVGRGRKNGDGPPAIIANVTKKEPIEDLADIDLVPSEVDGEPTDVIEVGEIKLHATDRQRPALGGDSVGHVDITAGTLGVVLQQGDKRVILSNNHVMANSNDAEVNDPILQPGPYDGGERPNDTIALLSDFVPVRFDDLPFDPSDCEVANNLADFLNKLAEKRGRETRLIAVKPRTTDNLVDAAIAEPLRATDVSLEIRGLGLPTGFADASVDETVYKSGRTTGLTSGQVLQVDVTVNVQFGAGRVAIFEDQVMAGPMSQPGDSGSAVLNADNEIVGLLFAGSDQVTIFNRIANVREAFGLSLPNTV